MRGLCTRLGERHVMLEPAGEQEARAALRKLGYPVGPDNPLKRDVPGR